MKAKDQSMNVWKANGIPRLEFCSIGRATQLLSCEEADIHQWISLGIVERCIKLPKPMSGRVEIYTDTDIDLLKLDYQGALSLSLELGLSQLVCDYDGHIDKEKTFLGVYAHEVDVTISGIWNTHTLRLENPNEYEEYIDGNDKELIYVNTFLPLEYGDLVKFLIVVTDEVLAFKSEDYVISGNDIEMLYNAGCTGEKLYRKSVYESLYENNYKKMKMGDIPEIKVTVHQIDMIKGLMRLLDFTDDEIKNSSATEINNKLSLLAVNKKTTCRTPDQKTWDKWRQKMG